METAVALGRGYCNISKVATIVVMFCCLSLFILGFSNRNAVNLYSKTTKGELSNVHVTTETSDKGVVTYSTLAVVTYTYNGEPMSQSVVGSKVYSEGQKVDVLYDPKTGNAVLKDGYVSPATTAMFLMIFACCFILLLILYFLFLNTDAGCAIAVFDRIF